MTARMVSQPSGVPDVVERANIGDRRAIGGLVRLLGGADLEIVMAAARALLDLGQTAVVWPLVAWLPRAASSRHRIVILTVLEGFGPEHYSGIASGLRGQET